jgi:hypothetical protein
MLLKAFSRCPRHVCSTPNTHRESGRVGLAAGQIRALLDKRVGDAVTFALATGAVRLA